MPLRVACPSCSATITTADKAAGKTVACPKCKSLMQIPAAEAIEDDIEIMDDIAPAPAPIPRRATPSRIERDDDDDDDRPRRTFRSRPQPRRRKKSGGFPVLPVVLLAGLVVLLLGGGVLVWALIPRGGGAVPRIFASSSSNPASVSWTKFESPDGSFSAEFPYGPPANGAGIMGTGMMPGGNERGQVAMWNRVEGKRGFVAGYVTLPAQIAGMMTLDQMFANTKTGPNQNGVDVVAFENATMGGQPAKRLVMRQKGQSSEFRMAKVKGHLFMVGVSNAENDPVANSFFDRFHVLVVPNPRDAGIPGGPPMPPFFDPSRGPERTERTRPDPIGPGPRIPGPIMPGDPVPGGPRPIGPGVPRGPFRPGGDAGRP